MRFIFNLELWIWNKTSRTKLNIQSFSNRVSSIWNSTWISTFNLKNTRYRVNGVTISSGMLCNIDKSVCWSCSGGNFEIPIWFLYFVYRTCEMLCEMSVQLENSSWRRRLRDREVVGHRWKLFRERPNTETKLGFSTWFWAFKLKIRYFHLENHSSSWKSTFNLIFKCLTVGSELLIKT